MLAVTRRACRDRGRQRGGGCHGQCRTDTRKLAASRKRRLESSVPILDELEA
jgi:hypothetical protein